MSEPFVSNYYNFPHSASELAVGQSQVLDADWKIALVVAGVFGTIAALAFLPINSPKLLAWIG